jgi:hypothetical protein
LRALADAWTTAAREGGDERPAIRRMAIYRAMKGTLAPKQVAIELETLAREGLVVADGDELRCGTEKETQAAATDDTAAAEPVTNVDETRGARRGAKRGREGAEGHDSSEAGDETEDERGGPVSGGHEARGRRRRRARRCHTRNRSKGRTLVAQTTGPRGDGRPGLEYHLRDMGTKARWHRGAEVG